MVAGPSAIGSTPQVHFRPDPGEPAARLSAPEHQTAGLVTTQEQRNETRLRLRALISGDDVLYTRRTFTQTYGENSPVFNAGLTTVVSRTDGNGFVPDNTLVPSESGENGVNQTEEEGEEKETNGLQAEEESQNALQPSEEELEEKERELENEDARLDRNLTRAQLEQNQALESNNPAQFRQAKQEEDEIEREQEEVEREKNEVELQKMAAQLKELLNSTNQALEDNAQAAFGLLDVMFGFDKENQSQDGPLSGPLPADPTFARAR